MRSNLPRNRAIIDIGSNNIYLLVGTYSQRGVSVLHRLTAVTALSEGMNNHHLSDIGIHRTISKLDDLFKVALSYTNQIAITGTSCSRDAQNISILSNYISEKYNIQYRILSAIEESYLTGLATVISFPALHAFISFDIGGGSTEFSFYRNGCFEQLVSIDLGLRRFQNRYGSDLQAIESYIHQALENFSFKASGSFPWIGVGLTVGNLSCLIQHLRVYEHEKIHGSCINKEDLLSLRNMIDNISDSDLRNLMPFEPQDKSVILSGLLYIFALMNLYRFDRFIVSNNNLTYGLLSLDEDHWSSFMKNHDFVT